MQIPSKAPAAGIALAFLLAALPHAQRPAATPVTPSAVVAPASPRVAA